MKKQSALFIAGAFMFAFSACNSTKQPAGTTIGTTTGTAATAEKTQNGAGQVMEKNGIRIYGFDDSPKMPTAALKINTPANNATVPAGKATFTYSLSNFELTKMTGHEHSKEMANSMQGQHIHHILDNEPYIPLYETTYTRDVKEGHHVVLSFLSRSYHESLKHRTAYDLRTFSAGNPGGANPFNVNGQHMFYSRPKGEYVGNDTKKIMLDFYLVNTTLSPGGNKVRATINGTEFMLNAWLPYIMEGLPMGQNTIKLELVDNNGNLIPGPYNSVERTITLKAS